MVNWDIVLVCPTNNLFVFGNVSEYPPFKRTSQYILSNSPTTVETINACPRAGLEIETEQRALIF